MLNTSRDAADDKAFIIIIVRQFFIIFNSYSKIIKFTNFHQFNAQIELHIETREEKSWNLS